MHGQLRQAIENFGAPYIGDLRLFSNSITGHVSQSMCQMQFLSVGILDLSNNFLEGKLTECFHSQNIWMLILSNNRFSGKFPPSLQRRTDLYILDLDYKAGAAPPSRVRPASPPPLPLEPGEASRASLRPQTDLAVFK